MSRNNPTRFGTAQAEAQARRELRAQVARLEAAIEAKDAMLRSLLDDGRLSATTHDNIQAALSDTQTGTAGEGWPEAVRQAKWALGFADAFYQRVITATLNWGGLEEMQHFETLFAGLQEDARGRQKVNRAALDRLGGK